jgi:hypothetical protein
MATVENTSPRLSHLLQTHQKIADLVGGAANLREAAEEMLYDIAGVRATS